MRLYLFTVALLVLLIEILKLHVVVHKLICIRKKLDLDLFYCFFYDCLPVCVFMGEHLDLHIYISGREGKISAPRFGLY